MTRKNKWFFHFIKHHSKSIITTIIALILLFLGGIGFWISSFEIPDLKSFENRNVAQSTKIYDRTGQILLFDVNHDVKRQEVAFDQISPYIKKAVIAIEDADFYQHHGIKITSIIRAVLANLTGQSTQGGSTITQQVIKNSLLTADRSISRKIKEWVLAIRLEKIMTKEEILNIYLNESPYGGSLYGIEEASQTFFGKKAGDVTLAEAAYLAAIPNAPTYYSPYGNNKKQLGDRKNLVLEKMLENKFITKAEFDSAKKEVVAFKPKQDSGIKAPHFVEYVKQYLVDKYGEREIQENGLKVTTTLDYGLQKQAEEIVKKYSLENQTTFNASNAALVVFDPTNGQILSMVGSRDYFDKTIDGNFNVALAKRQPGSTFKPFVYATAFKKGYTPETILFDLPTQFQTTCTPDGKPIGNTNPDNCYMPENYDGKYLGPMTLRDALAQSRNIPAIKTLYLAGIRDSINTAKQMGISSLGDANQYGLTLVLGGGEVSLLELTGAYGVFANAGTKNETVSIIKVEDGKGNILEENKALSEKVLEPDIANQISSILSDNKARTPAYGANSPLYVKDQPVAVKTGTTNDYRDVWIVGYTPNLVVGAWMGNNDNTTMVKKTAGLIISPMWRAVLDVARANRPKEYFDNPIQTDKDLKPVLRGYWQGNESYLIDKVSGKLATDKTPKETSGEIFVPNVHEILFWVDKNDPLGPIPEHPENDPQFKLWEYPLSNWLKTQEINNPNIPSDYDDVHTTEKSPKVFIEEPNQTSYSLGQKITVRTKFNNIFPITKVDFYLNNVYLGSSEQSPFLFSFVPNATNTFKNNTLRVVVTDMVYNRAESEVSFQVQ